MRIKDKIEEIESYLSELEEIMPEDFEEYKKIEKKAACERYFEKIVESLIDLGFITIKELKLKMPEEDTGVFDELFKENIISEKLKIKLREAKGMRNIITHKYGVIDDLLVYESITSELEKDTIEFIKSIKLKFELK
jgi:uncharacterized protein YutE (UPF0331/DUF86 family)